MHAFCIIIAFDDVVVKPVRVTTMTWWHGAPALTTWTSKQWHTGHVDFSRVCGVLVEVTHDKAWSGTMATVSLSRGRHWHGGQVILEDWGRQLLIHAEHGMHDVINRIHVNYTPFWVYFKDKCTIMRFMHTFKSGTCKYQGIMDN